MISDHSANERTFLAWVRPAIAVIAFGSVEKLDLFLEVAVPSLAGRTLSGQKFGNIAGLVLIVLGTARWSALQLFVL